MSSKNYLKREFNNIKRELAQAISKEWRMNYKGNEILVCNEMKAEKLFVNGQLIASKSRKSIFSQFLPYVHLKGSFELEDGTTCMIHAKVGGYLTLNCIIKINGELVLNDSTKLEYVPWEHKEKIVPYLLEQIESKGIVGNDLPDDILIYDNNHPKVAPGLDDHLVEKVQPPFLVSKLVKLLEDLMTEPTLKTRTAIYERVMLDRIAVYGGNLIREIKQKNWDDQKIQEEAIWFLDHAAHREVVKFALVLLASTQCENHKDLIMNIGKHEEFTGYAVIALKKGTYQWNDAVYELARELNGWGKLTCVSILNPTSNEIKEWLITKGFENTVDHEALAYLCAVKGDLDIFLEKEEITNEVYNGASEIISTLIYKKGPDSMEDYAYAKEVMSDYLRHSKTMVQSIEQFHTIAAIERFIMEEEEIWEERYNQNKWYPHQRETLKQELAYFKNEIKWIDEANERLTKGVSFEALQVLKFFQVDICTYVFQQLLKDTSNLVLITEILNMDNQAAIDQLCSVVLESYQFNHLTLNELIAFQLILEYLNKHEGSGLQLVYHALNHELEPVQEKGLSILQNWNPSVWRSTKLVESIEYLLKNSKNKQIKYLAKQILGQ